MEDNIKVLYEKFTDVIEQKDLLNLEIEEIKIWHYSQFEIFNLILTGKDIFCRAHSIINFKDSVKTFPRVIFNSIFKSALHSKEDSKILVFNHPRKMLVENSYMDIYTQYYIENIKDI